MRWLEVMQMRVRLLFRRGRESQRLDAELQYHLERQITENVAEGMSAKEARHAALRVFGNPALLREQARAAWSWNWLEALWRDLRYGARTLRRTPGFTCVAILVMALGIGSSVALFAVVRGVLLKPLPFKDPDRLMMVYERGTGGDLQSNPFNIVSGAMYAEWRKQNRSFSDLALVGYNGVKSLRRRRTTAGTPGKRNLYMESVAYAWSFTSAGTRLCRFRRSALRQWNRASELESVAAPLRRRSGHPESSHPPGWKTLYGDRHSPGMVCFSKRIHSALDSCLSRQPS
jgi:hypothetical protein